MKFHFYPCIFISHFVLQNSYFTDVSSASKGPGRSFGPGKKAKPGAGSEYEKKPRNSLKLGTTSRKGRTAEKNMSRGSLKKRDKSREKERKFEAMVERKTVNLPEGSMTVSALADLMDEKPISVIKFLMTDLGVMAGMTQSLDPVTIRAVVEGFGMFVGGDDESDDYDSDDEE